MKLQITQENLNKALNSVSRIASSRATLPILSNILIKTIDNRVSISATNLNVAVTHYVGSKVNQPGSITVPARLTQDFISNLSAGVINIELKDSKLHINTDSYNSTINGIPADDFPVMPNIKKGESWEIDSLTLKKALQQVVVAASSDDTRPVLTAVYIHVTKGRLFAVATDSYRLAEKNISKLDKEVSLLIPSSTINELLRIVDDTDQKIKIKHDDQQVLFSVGELELVSRLIDGSYPPYKKLIPEKFKTSASLLKTELQNIVKVSSLFARENAGSITINIDESLGEINIQSIASQLGENTAKSKADVNGSGSITLNSRYILDALNAIPDKDITICFNDKLEPCVIKGKSSDYIHIVMPLKS